MAPPVVAITGINGFVGKHVAREFADNGYSVIGIGRDAAVAGEIAGLVSNYASTDLSKEWPEVGDVDMVVHLAGLASVGQSFDEPQLFIETNSRIVTNLGEYFLSRERRPRIIGVSSGAVYGSTHSGPIDESAELGISSPYVVSKLLVESQLTYYTNRGLECVIARPFNHLGPGQSAGFILPDLVGAVAASMESGQPATTGDLTTVRDYTDVRDVAVAYRLLATTKKLNHRVYNICSGSGASGEQLLGLVLDALGSPDVTITLADSIIRPTDPSVIVGDASRIFSDVGWEPRIALEQSVRESISAPSL